MTIKKYKLPGSVKAYLDEYPSPLYTEWVMPEDLEEEPPCPEGGNPVEWSASNDFPRKRLEYMRGLMSRMLYDSKKHEPILRKKWHLAQREYKYLAAEASRQLEIIQGRDDLRLKETIATLLLEVAGEARKNRQLTAAVMAYNTILTHLTDKTQKIDITHEVKFMSTEDLQAAYLKEIEAGEKTVGIKLLEGKKVPDADFEEEEEPDMVEVLRNSPETPRNDDGDRITPLMPEEDE